MQFKRTLRLFINALHSKSGGGITYLSNMLPILAKRPDLEVYLCLNRQQLHLFPEIFKYVPQAEDFTCVLPNLKLYVVDFRYTFFKTLIFEQVKLPFLVRKIDADITFSPANFGPIFAPRAVLLLRNALSVAFIERRLTKRFYWCCLYVGTLISIFSARKVISVSNFAKRAAIGPLLSFVPADISTIPHGVSKIFHPRSFDTRSRNQILVVSDLYIQKNLHTLLRAMPAVLSKLPSVSLTIVGAPIDTEYTSLLTKLVSQQGLDSAVEFLGRITPEELCELYQNCALFVFPSTIETFGNPILEALASGAPTACSRVPAMQEVAGDAAIYFDPTDVNGMVEVIVGLLKDSHMREQLSDKGIKRSSLFSWERTADATVSVFKSAASEK